jgi:hypothetical protein
MSPLKEGRWLMKEAVAAEEPLWLKGSAVDQTKISDISIPNPSFAYNVDTPLNSPVT